MQILIPLTAQEVAQNRAIFLYHLRVNPDKVKQITGALKRSADAMCAIGLGCDAFQIPMTEWDKAALGVPSEYDPYAALANKLGVPGHVISSLYSLNDGSGLTFAQVADVAEAYFKSDGSSNPLQIWRAMEVKEAV